MHQTGESLRAAQTSPDSDIAMMHEASAVFRYAVENAPSGLDIVSSMRFAFLWYVFDGEDPFTQRTFRREREELTIFDAKGRERCLTEGEIEIIMGAAKTASGETAGSLNHAIGILSEMQELTNPISVDRFYGEDGATLGNVLVDEGAHVEKDSLRNTSLGRIEEIMKACGLTDNQVRALVLRFGLDDRQARTLEEVGHEMNVTRQRAAQLENAALRKLRLAKAEELWDLLG